MKVDLARGGESFFCSHFGGNGGWGELQSVTRNECGRGPQGKVGVVVCWTPLALNLPPKVH